MTLRVEDILKYPKLIPVEFAREQLAALDPVVWAQRYLTTEKGQPLEYKDRGYLKEFMRDFHPHIAVKKGAQIAITTSSIIKLLFFVDNHKVTSIYTFPTKNDVNEFSNLRFKPMIINSPFLLSKMQGVDNASVKQFGLSTIYFRGTWTEKQALSIPADILVHDELDFSRPDIKEIYGPRLSVSDYKFVWEFSTPTLPKYGIDGIFKLSDQKYWFVKCHCGRWQIIDYFKNVFKRRKSGYYFGCKYCRATLDRKKGEWITAYPNRTKNNEGIRGYFIPQTICPVISADYLVKQHIKSKSSPKSERVFFNFNLGLAYESGVDVLTKTSILDKILPIHDTFEHTYMGVDQGDMLHIEICGNSDRRKIIYLEVTDRFSRITELIEQYNPLVVIIDAMPNKHSAKEIRDKFKGKVYIAYYSNLEGLWNPRNPDKEPYSILINNLDVMDNTAAQWNKGEVILSSGIEHRVVEQFASHMVNLKRDVVEDRNGQNIPRWVKVGSDHFRHADAYAYIATKILAGESGEEVDVSGYISPPSFEYSAFSEGDVW